MERIMVTRITKYMVHQNLLNHYQAGFKRGKSCVHQLLRLAEHVSTWFSKRGGGRTVSLFIDAEKSFDTVWLDGIRKMLHDSKIPIKLVRWISSFLQNRKGSVRVNNILSRKFPLQAGVPQGSILAPLLYIYFIRDMPTINSQEIISSFYADDTSYAASEDNRNSRKVFPAFHFQNIINQIEAFCKDWRIGLNPDKTWCLNFYTKKVNNNSPRLWLRGELLKYKKQIKFLGITFDEHLTFEAHIQDIISRCKKRLNLLKAIRGNTWGAHPDTLIYTYKVFIRPLLEYGCILFAHAKEKLLKKIQAVEIEAIKIAFRLPPWTSHHWCYNHINFENILERIKSLGKNFLNKNKNDFLIKPLIEASKPSMNGTHSPIFKMLNW